MDRASIDDLYRAYGSMVYRRARAILGEEHAAHDAVQEVFVRAIRSDVEFYESTSPTTWLYRVTTNYCLNLRRNRQRRDELDAVRAPPPQETADDLDDRLFVLELLSRLPEELSQIAVYYYYDQMNQAEIASILGVSRRTVGNRLEEFKKQARLAVGEPLEVT